jgi:capsid assembly protease
VQLKQAQHHQAVAVSLGDCEMLKSRIMSLLVNRPLMALPSVAMTIQSVIAGWDGSAQMMSSLDRPNHKASRFAGEAIVGGGRLLYTRIQNVAVVTVDGEMVNRGAWIGADSGLVSYEGIDAQLNMAASDPKVSAILIDTNTPGGDAIGAMELAATVRRIAATKPVFAFVNGMACSAGYALVSGATKIFTAPSGISGSIGVVMLHMDHSGELKEAGIVPTLIHAGAHKVDANPFEPLSKAVKGDLQGEVMKFYDLFVSTVAAGRKGLTPDAIRNTEARTYIGQEAVDAGLVDTVSTFEDILSEITRAVGRSTVSTGGQSMSDNPGAPAASNAGITPEMQASAVQSAVAAATTRMQTVMSHADVSGNASRMKAATELLATTSMTADQVVGFVTKNVAATAAVPTIEQRAAEAQIDTGTKPAATVKINATAIYASRQKARIERGAIQ